MVAVQTRNRQMPKISRVKLLKKIKISTSAGATGFSFRRFSTARVGFAAIT